MEHDNETSEIGREPSIRGEMRMANENSPNRNFDPQQGQDSTSKRARADRPVTSNPLSGPEVQESKPAVHEPIVPNPIKGRGIRKYKAGTQPVANPISGRATKSGMKMPDVKMPDEDVAGWQENPWHSGTASTQTGAAGTTTTAGSGAGAYTAPSTGMQATHSSVMQSRDAGSGKRWWGAPLALLIVVAILVAVAFVIPLPFVITKPGPTFDVTGSVDGNPVIEVHNDEAVTTSNGQLRMVTVSSYGGPGSNVSLAQIIQALLTDGNDIERESDVYPEDISREELDEIAMTQMTSSQSTAAAVALEELGYNVSGSTVVAGTVAGSHAEGIVQEGDILLAIITPDGVRHEVDKPSVPFTVPKDLAPETPVTLEVMRQGGIKEIEMKTYLPEDAPADTQGSKFGIYLLTDVRLPFEVDIHLEEVGGPSAGMMFALGIIDQLTGGESTGGAIVAGTGSIGYGGDVQPIGGIVQKMYGAKRDGAQWFLAPRSNCDEVIGNEPDGLEVWPVSTLGEARDALKAISAGATVNHPVCEAE
jgi:PDZ domain-containing protein